MSYQLILTASPEFMTNDNEVLYQVKETKNPIMSFITGDRYYKIQSTYNSLGYHSNGKVELIFKNMNIIGKRISDFSLRRSTRFILSEEEFAMFVLML